MQLSNISLVINIVTLHRGKVQHLAKTPAGPFAYSAAYIRLRRDIALLILFLRK
jgi:hypothetical protein